MRKTKKNYSEVKIEILQFESCDIVTTSDPQGGYDTEDKTNHDPGAWL